jgi:hypothetical protein
VLHTAALLGPDEIVMDPFPLLSELTPGMHARDWGRVVVVNSPGPAVSGHELALRWGAPVMWLTLTFRGADSWHGILMQHCGIARGDIPLEPQEVTVNRYCAVYGVRPV